MIAAALLACAANIAPVTLDAIVAVESRGEPLAILDNATGRSYHPRDQDEAIALARRLVAAGHRIDAGLMQVDSVNWPALGLDASRIFEPCTNIRAGGEILTADYAHAARTYGEGQAALKHALSAYNTGDFYRGFRNGYVARYYGRAAVPAVSVHVHFAALKRGRENRHQPDAGQARPNWTRAQLARLAARSTVYTKVAVNFPIR